MFKNKNKLSLKGEKTIRTIRMGTNKKIVLILWKVLIGSVAFGIYKNFTAIDKHTTHEKEIVQLKLIDTNGVENYVKNFAKSYYTWSNNKESIQARTQAINGYLTKELQDLNANTVRFDIPTSSTIQNILIWSVKQVNEHEYVVTYEVAMTIKEAKQEKKVNETYTVHVHVDNDGNMVIDQNPTLVPTIEKSTYEPKVSQDDANIDADTIHSATTFLETFFKLYPTANGQELSYYVQGDALKPIQGDYLFSGLVNPVFTKSKGELDVKLAVKFIDKQTKAEQISQYHLTLVKNKNWVIESVG